MSKDKHEDPMMRFEDKTVCASCGKSEPCECVPCSDCQNFDCFKERGNLQSQKPKCYKKNLGIHKY